MKINSEKKNKFMEKYAVFCDMVLLACLFIVTCLPILTIGASVAAYYHSVNKVLRKGEGYLFRTYMTSWKENMKQGIVLTLFTLLIGGLGAGSVWLVGTLCRSGQMNASFLYLRWLVFLPLVLVLPWEFIYLSRFSDTTGTIIRNSFTLGFAKAGVTLLADLTIALVVVIILFMIPALPFVLTPLVRLISRKTEPVLLEVAKNAGNYDPHAWYGEDSLE